MFTAGFPLLRTGPALAGTKQDVLEKESEPELIQLAGYNRSSSKPLSVLAKITMDGRAWWAIVPRVTKESDTTEVT